MLDPPVVRAPPQQDVLTRSPRDVLFELLCHVHLKDILSLRCVGTQSYEYGNTN